LGIVGGEGLGQGDVVLNVLAGKSELAVPVHRSQVLGADICADQDLPAVRRFGPTPHWW
jgi:hypothetical protein